MLVVLESKIWRKTASWARIPISTYHFSGLKKKKLIIYDIFISSHAKVFIILLEGHGLLL